MNDQAAEPTVEEQPEVVELPDEGDGLGQAATSPEEPFSWQASEYVHHHKSASWYVWLGLILLVLLIGAVIFKQWLSIAVFVVMGAAIAIYANKPPRVLTYELDSAGVTIEGRAYPFQQFRSFAVMRDADWHAIDLEPTQRFMPRLTLLFADGDYDSIVSHLDTHLPRVDREPDVVERLSRYLRF